jgi:hypothetical protein
MSYSWGVGLGSARTDSLPVVHAPARPGAGVTVRRRIPEEPTSEMWQLAVELAPMVDVWQRLLAQHVPDRSGRCRTCTKGGTGLPALSWPCSIHGVADLARRCHAESVA